MSEAKKKMEQELKEAREHNKRMRIEISRLETEMNEYSGRQAEEKFNALMASGMEPPAAFDAVNEELEAKQRDRSRRAEERKIEKAVADGANEADLDRRIQERARARGISYEQAFRDLNG